MRRRGAREADASGAPRSAGASVVKLVSTQVREAMAITDVAAAVRVHLALLPLTDCFAIREREMRSEPRGGGARRLGVLGVLSDSPPVRIPCWRGSTTLRRGIATANFCACKFDCTSFRAC